jgi:diguanylate cyclase (GGDEF)-like protein
MDPDAETLTRLLDHLNKKRITASDRELLARLIRERLASIQVAGRGDTFPPVDGMTEGGLPEQVLRESLEQRITELETLRQVSLNLTASLDLQTVLKIILESVLHLIPDVADAHIFLYENDRLNFGAALWSDGRDNIPWTTPRPHGLTYTVARHGEILHVPDMSRHYLYRGTGWSGAIIGIPLKVGTRVVGVMTAARERPGPFTSDDLRLLQLLADHAAISINNARKHKQAYLEAHLDPLTGLPNRRALEERLQFECQQAQNLQTSFAFMMLDLDGFKVINDTYGHLLGDQVLKIISQDMQNAVRDKDSLARYGGDELALILPDTSMETAVAVARRIQNSLANLDLHLPGAPDQRVSVSVGIAIFPNDAYDWLSLIQAADQNLYQAKHLGPGSVLPLLSELPPSQDLYADFSGN